VKSLRILALAAVVVAGLGSANQAHAVWPRQRADYLASRYAEARPWHGNYYHTRYGVPLALVVPPNAKVISSYGWGVTATEINPLYHQFQRPFPGYIDASGAMLLPTPPWPSHTDQFGVYPIRGPW
jgi:hypothetical protein